MKLVNSVAMVINHYYFIILSGEIAPVEVNIYYGVHFAEQWLSFEVLLLPGFQ